MHDGVLKTFIGARHVLYFKKNLFFCVSWTLRDVKSLLKINP